MTPNLIVIGCCSIGMLIRGKTQSRSSPSDGWPFLIGSRWPLARIIIETARAGPKTDHIDDRSSILIPYPSHSVLDIGLRGGVLTHKDATGGEPASSTVERRVDTALRSVRKSRGLSLRQMARLLGTATGGAGSVSGKDGNAYHHHPKPYTAPRGCAEILKI